MKIKEKTRGKGHKHEPPARGYVYGGAGRVVGRPLRHSTLTEEKMEGK
jgi:hypothetical protein